MHNVTPEATENDADQPPTAAAATATTAAAAALAAAEYWAKQGTPGKSGRAVSTKTPAVAVTSAVAAPGGKGSQAEEAQMVGDDTLTVVLHMAKRAHPNPWAQPMARPTLGPP